MKSSDARRVYIILLLLGFAANLALLFFFWNRTSRQAQVAAADSQKKLLSRLKSSFSFEKVYLSRFADLFARSESLNTEELPGLITDWQKNSGLADAGCEIIFFKGFEPLNSPPDQRAEWKFLFTQINSGRFRKFRISGTDKNRIVRFLNGAVGFERLEGKPGQLRRININDRRTFGVWFDDPQRERGAADGMLAISHSSRISRKLLAKALFESMRVNPEDYGYLNLFDSEDSLLPKDVDPFRFKTAIDSVDARNGPVRLTVEGKNYLVMLSPDGHIFVARERQVTVPIPFWCLALFFFWLPVWLNAFVCSAGKFKLSLPVLLVFVVAISMALPAAATAFYWNIFLESRRESLKISAADQMQNHLVQLDAGFQQVFRDSQLQYQQLTALMNGKPENLQKFIDRSVQLELAGMYDTCMLINPEGQFVRPSAGSTFGVRKLVFYNRAYREKVFDQYFAWGWVPFDLEAAYALETPTENVDVMQFISLMPSQGKTAYTSFASFTAKDIIRLHNSRFAGNSDNLKDGVSSMLMSSFIADEDENPVARIYQSLGSYFDFGFGINQSVNYVDLITDAAGRANYCMILFSGKYNYSNRYFDHVFTNESRWPAGVRYFAITDRLFGSNYPVLDLWKRCSWLMALMQPPRNTHVQEVMIDNQPHLLCSYVARQCHGYILVAAIPLKNIDAQLDGLRQKMLLAALLLAATLVFVLVRLNLGIIVPARQIMQGVRAIESRDHSHKVSISTNDEWQQLAETFNSSLESMKELEVAHFVQTCILPQSDIVSGPATFAGRTVPADDVGGDYFDAFVPAPGEMTFVMGDVSGHSVSAALVVSMARAGFAALVDSGLKLPHEIFAAFNHLMLEHLRRVKMMTCFAGHIGADGRLTCSNAGQTFPLIISDAGRVETLSMIGYPLGSARRKAFKSETRQLPDVCRLMLFSDGVVEALNAAGEPFGYPRLEALVGELGCHCSRETFFAGIYSAVREFSGAVPWGDDVTIALLDFRRNPL
ncbi:MAG TPA: SpoIIE family protein phosphatase [Candidatus Rifleibacterium sp.]|nr:SpoIIE family protein phosphatase [Candidatus Rifleibacterium sp.]HPT46773.1 SpoIIE family protein phosphatase [Candidatus Rifleibacterium sp.]